MWDWDTIIEKFAGSKLARDLRTHQFRQDIRRAGIAQERRARSAATSGAVTSHRARSPAPRAARASPAGARSPRTDAPLYITQPGSLRPRRVPFRHPLYYEVPVAPARPTTRGDFVVDFPGFEGDGSEGAGSPRDSVAPCPVRRSPLLLVASPVLSHESGSVARRDLPEVRRVVHASFESGLGGRRGDGEMLAALVDRRKVRIVSPEEAVSAVASDTEEDSEEEA